MTVMGWRDDPVRRILTAADEARLVEAIRRAEGATSGEIRVHVEARAGADALAVARRWFHKLGIDRTRERNGVLVYVAVEDRALAVVGDQGIHEKAGAGYWDAMRDDLQAAFARGEYADGLVRAVERAGTLLAEHFPPRDGDVNELSDAVSR